jgi:hypothetical protein
MEKNFSDILGIALLIMALAMGMSLGVCAVVRANEQLSTYDLTLEDKTAQLKNSPSVSTAEGYDGTLSRGEVFLVAAIQDTGMSGERLLEIGNHTVTVNASYMETATTTASQYANALVQSAASQDSFAITYKYSSSSYKIYKK